MISLKEVLFLLLFAACAKALCSNATICITNGDEGESQCQHMLSDLTINHVPHACAHHLPPTTCATILAPFPGLPLPFSNNSVGGKNFMRYFPPALWEDRGSPEDEATAIPPHNSSIKTKC